MDFINQQLGKIMLALAVVATIVSTSMNAPRELPAVDQQALSRPVQVGLDKNALIVASSETYYAAGPGAQYMGPERCLFVQEKKVKEFQPVLLELPPASIMRGPPALPEPGPSLEGSHKLPRYGDEFPPVTVAPSLDTPARGGNTGTTPAPATGTKPATPTTPVTPTPPGKTP
jgi:hypothetical protein